MSIADSPSEMAVNMKHQVRDLLSRGYTQEQILDYFERSYGQFQRSIRVPHSVKGEQVQARVENGVLTIVLPKNQVQEKARHIEVKGGTH